MNYSDTQSRDARIARDQARRLLPAPRRVSCPCACNSGGFCGGCGHAGCGGRR